MSTNQKPAQKQQKGLSKSEKQAAHAAKAAAAAAKKKPAKVKGPQPVSYAPNLKRRVRTIAQSFQGRCLAASMNYLYMLSGVTGEYVVPITYQGNGAGSIIIKPTQKLGHDDVPFDVLMDTGSSFAGIHASEDWYLPVKFLKFKEPWINSNNEALVSWQLELHAALRGLIWDAIATHFDFAPPQVKAIKPLLVVVKVNEPTRSAAVPAAEAKKAKPLAPQFQPLSRTILSKDGRYESEEGVVVEAFTKGGVRKVAAYIVPIGYQPLLGMEGYYTYLSNIENFNDDVRDKFVSWLRDQLGIRAEEAIAA